MSSSDSQRRSSRVLDAAGRFEHSFNMNRLDPQQQTVSADLEHLSLARKVNGLRLSYSGIDSQESSPASPTTPTARPVSPVLDESSSCAARAPGAGSLANRAATASRPRAYDVLIATNELDCSIQDVTTLLFEIQELRHSTPLVLEPRSHTPTRQLSEPSLSSSQGSMSPSISSTAESASTRATTVAPSALDSAIDKLKFKTDLIEQAQALIEIDVRTLEREPSSREVARALTAWEEAVASWSNVKRDIEILHTELAEDKWLTMFRTVAAQADDMMRSLESVLAQHDEVGLQFTSGNEDFIRGLQSKIESYAPACERVLRILAKNIAERSTRNGEALRAYSDAKLRWDRLRQRVAQTESAQVGSSVAEARTPARTFSPRRSNPRGSPNDSPIKERASSRSRASSLSRSIASPDKPRWNISTKRSEADSTRTPGNSGRTSALGHRRPSSRPSISLSLSQSDQRPVSPAFSDASSTMSRDRPSTPSKIPMPSSGRRQSMTPSAFGSESTSLMQRALSPTPTSRRVSMGGARARQSLGSSLGLPRVTSPKPSIASVMSRSRTPEPRRVSDRNRPPPVPALPASYRSDNQSTPRSVSASAAIPTSSSRRQSLLPTPLASSRRRSISPLPPNLGMQSDGTYAASPVDPLDKHVANIVNSISMLGRVETTRVDAPFTIAQVATLELLSAKYVFGARFDARQADIKPVLCKLVDRVGRGAVKGDKKVLVRIATGWQDLDQFLSTVASTSTVAMLARDDEFETF
ncbi:hypothetical protein ACM66B_001963 [Microbotryomycetes sp. NB124-2]